MIRYLLLLTIGLVWLVMPSQAQFPVSNVPMAGVPNPQAACFTTPQQCLGQQNPCSLAPTCSFAPQALCYPNYCLGSPCGVTQYYYANPTVTFSAAVPNCPTVQGQGGVSTFGNAWPGVPNQPVNGFMNNGFFSPGFGVPGFGTGFGVAASTQTCSQLINQVLGPAAAGAVVMGRKKRETLISRVRRQLYVKDTGRPERNPWNLAVESPTLRSENSTQSPALGGTGVNGANDLPPTVIDDGCTEEGLCCNQTGCYVKMADESAASSSKFLLRGRWHQTHKLVFLRACDVQLYTTQCQFGQQCCQVYSVFNKYFCLGTPSNPYQPYTGNQNAQLPYFVAAGSLWLSNAGLVAMAAWAVSLQLPTN